MISRILMLLTLALMATLSIADTQFSGRRELEAEVSRLLSIKAFDDIDRLEKSLRSNNAMSASGWPLLFMFYQSLDNHPTLRKATLKELDQFDSAMNHWLAKSPSSHFGHFLKVDILRAYAWRARGTGYSHTVSKAQWEAFHLHMNQAHEYLERHKRELTENPNWYMDILQIAQQQSWPKPKYDAVIKEALSRHGTYLPILTTSIYHLTPKWGGSYNQMIEFINDSTARLPAPLSDEIYARQYSYAIENALFSNISSSRVNCKQWLKGYEEITQKYPTSYNFNHAAYAAVVCANKRAAKQYLAYIGKKSPDLSFWGTSKTFARARKWAIGRQ